MSAVPFVESRRRRALWLVWFVKEWRAQRGMLLAYAGLAFAVLACLFWSRPLSSFRIEAGDGGGIRFHALPTVVALHAAVAAFGVLALAAPQLVRGEHGVRGDVFLRRLPGALQPAFAGKVLFVVVVACVLVPAAIAVGHGLLWMRGLPTPWSWLDQQFLFRDRRGLTSAVLLGGSAIALLLVPWVAATATWLPAGRMAVGAALLLGLVVYLAARAVCGAYPGLEPAIAADSVFSVTTGIAYAVLLGLFVSWCSFVRGRRGGGPLRSVTLGAIATVGGLVPPAVWLASWVAPYERPDLYADSRGTVYGVTPDHRYALASLAGHTAWPGMPVRIDLASGDVVPLGAVGESVLSPHVLQRGAWHFVQQRFWMLREGRATFLLDAVTLRREPLSFDSDTGLVRVGAALRASLNAEARATTTLRAPGDRPVWGDGDRLCFAGEGDTVETVPWDPRDTVFAASGHALPVIRPGGERAWFDLTRRRFVPWRANNGFAVKDLWLVYSIGAGDAPSWRTRQPRWALVDPERGTETPLPALSGLRVVCLLDDETVLMWRRNDAASGEPFALFAYRPSTGALDPIACDSTVEVGRLKSASVARLVPVAGGRIWLKVRTFDWIAYLTVDPVTRIATQTLVRDVDVLGFLDEGTAIGWTSHGGSRRIVRVDVTTGEQAELFPRASRRMRAP